MKRLIYFLLVLIINGCSFFDFKEPYVKESYPSNEQVGISENDTIWVLFSDPMDRHQSENAFSLSSSDDTPRGEFRWDGNKMFFIPKTALKTGYTYNLVVSDEAEDENGNNLSQDYNINFVVNTDYVSPLLLSNIPAHNDNVNATDLQFTFSEAIAFDSLFKGITISPSVSGFFTQSADQTQVTFTPYDEFAHGTRYSVSINTDLTDIAGNTLQEKDTYSFQFTMGTDFIRPEIESILSGATNLIPDIETTNIEKSDDIVITFSEKMNLTTIDSAISFSPSVDHTRSYTTIGIAPNEKTQLTLSFPDHMEPETHYELTISNSVEDLESNTLLESKRYSFLTDGPTSIRPTVIGMHQALVNAGNCPDSTPCKYSGECGGGDCDNTTLNGNYYPALPGFLVHNDVLEFDQFDIDTGNAAANDMRMVLEIVFSQAMNAASLTNAIELDPIVSGSNTAEITGIGLINPTTLRVYIIDWTEADTVYKITVKGESAKDTNENPLKEDYILFLKK